MKPPVFNDKWSNEIKALFKHDMEQTWDRSLMPHLFHEYTYLLDFYLEYAPPNKPLRILDIGCAQGTLAMLLAEAGHRVVAVDLRQGFIDYAMSRYESGDIRFVCCNLFDFVSEEKFDLVFVNQVIEHMLSPLQLVQRACSWLRPGGRLVITTPNGLYVKNSLPTFSQLGPHENYHHLENSADGDGHFFAYTPNELRQIFAQAQMQEVHCQCIDTPWISGHMKFRYLHRFLAYGLFKTLDGLTRTLPFNNHLCSQVVISGIKG